MNRIKKPLGNLSTKMESIQKSQMEVLELKIVIFKLKTLLDGLNSLLDTAKENISETKHRAIGTV